MKRFLIPACLLLCACSANNATQDDNESTSFLSLEEENGAQQLGYWPSAEYIRSRAMMGNRSRSEWYNVLMSESHI